LATLLITTFAIILVGCSGDDPTNPVTESSRIVIDQTPDDLVDANWLLTGPQTETGSGDMTLTDMPAGDYTLTWNAVNGYFTPADDTQTLQTNGTVTFSGTYEEAFRTIVIVQTPDDLEDAGWSLTGPQTETSSGDTILTDMPVGDYTLTWNAVGGYFTPASDAQTLTAEGMVTFSGTYIEEAFGTIDIVQTPDVIAGSGWSLTGPQTETGSGDITLTDMPVGDYMLIWDVMDGYINPSDRTQTLTADGVLTFRGTYNEDPGLLSGFAQIPAGSFTMGSPPDELGRDSNETQHTVTLTTPFEIFTTEVTNQQYAVLAQWAFDAGHCTTTGSSLLDALDGSNTELLSLGDLDCEISFSSGIFTVDAGQEDHPVKEVTWYGAVAYCDWLSMLADLPRAYNHSTWLCNGNAPYIAQGYRLPTEAEWEYACRAGSGTAFANGEITDTDCNDPVLNEIGWYCGNADGWSQLVGQLIANDFDLYDMHGNIWEWCNDRYAGYGEDVIDPVGGSPNSSCVVRGGNWNYFAIGCRSACRLAFYPDTSYYSIGFRLAKSSN